MAFTCISKDADWANVRFLQVCQMMAFSTIHGLITPLVVDVLERRSRFQMIGIDTPAIATDVSRFSISKRLIGECQFVFEHLTVKPYGLAMQASLRIPSIVDRSLPKMASLLSEHDVRS